MTGGRGQVPGRAGRQVQAVSLSRWNDEHNRADNLGCDGPMQSVELTFDEESDRQIRAQWAALAEAGLPSQARHTGASNRPHITLALTNTVIGDVPSRLAAALATLPLPITLGGLLVFGSRRFVLARQAVPSTGLLDAQLQVTAALDDGLDPHQTFGPGRWTPHVTLARRLTAGQVGAALTVLGAVAPISGDLVRARRWDIKDKQEHWLDLTR